MSTDARGSSTKPDTFDPRSLSHAVKEALVCLPNLRSQFVELTKKLASSDSAGPDEDAVRTLARMLRTRGILSAPSPTLTARNRKRTSPELGVTPHEQVPNPDLALDDAGRNVPQVHCPLISNTTVRIASIARTLEHARLNLLHLLEVLKLQELAFSGKNKDKMVELATQNYESNTDKATSQHHIHVIKRTFQ